MTVSFLGAFRNSDIFINILTINPDYRFWLSILNIDADYAPDLGASMTISVFLEVIEK